MNRICKCEVQKLFPILEAIKEGKTIQFKDSDGWRDINGDDEGFYLSTLVEETDKYRIKPQPKYRPFKDTEECWVEMLKHQPFGWVRAKEDKSLASITLMISERDIFINCIGGSTMYDLMEKFTFADGAVFGILEEE